MALLPLSQHTGINVDLLVSWHNFPKRVPPQVLLTFAAMAADGATLCQIYVGPEREVFLAYAMRQPRGAR